MNRMRRPVLVTAAISVRLVVVTRERMASWLLRRRFAAVPASCADLHPDRAPRRREQHLARRVRDLEGRRGLAGHGGRDRRRRLGEQRAPRCAEPLGDLLEFVGDEPTDPGGIAEQALEEGDLGAQLVRLRLELDAAEPREAPQSQLQDVLGLELAELEDVDEPGAGLVAVVARADHLDDLVDVEDRDEQPLDEMQPLAAPGETELAAPAHDRKPMIEVDLEELLAGRACAGPRRRGRRC